MKSKKTIFDYNAKDQKNRKIYVTSPYLFFGSSTPTASFSVCIEFNYTLYSNCPENTEKENDKCICIKNKDWYKEQTLDGKLYYFCALNESKFSWSKS